MDTATLIIVHSVLSLGNLRATAKKLARPVATVSGALSRFQSHLATPLTTRAGNRLLPTLEGRRINRELEKAVVLIAQLAQQDGRTNSAYPSLSLLALSRFNLVARTGSIRAAAAALRMGQPQLTRQISALETQIGTPLLQRSAAGTTLTPRGMDVLVLSEQLIGIWDHISERAGERFRQSGRRIRLGAVTPLGWGSRIAANLARLANEWPDRHPRSLLYISSNSADELLTGLSRRQHDFVLLDTEEIPDQARHRVLSRSPLALVASPQRLQSKNGDIRSLLMEGPLVLPSPKSGLRQKFVSLADDMLQTEERSGLSVIEVDSIPVIANLVIDHDHVSLLPLSAIHGMDGRMIALPLPERYAMPLVLAWRSDSNLEAIASSIAGILAETEARAGETDLRQGSA